MHGLRIAKYNAPAETTCVLSFPRSRERIDRSICTAGQAGAIKASSLQSRNQSMHASHSSRVTDQGVQIPVSCTSSIVCQLIHHVKVHMRLPNCVQVLQNVDGCKKPSGLETEICRDTYSPSYILSDCI